MFDVFDSELRAANEMPGSALGRCHGTEANRSNGYVNDDGVNCNRNCKFYDRSVGRYEEFWFALGFVHKSAALSTHGYITEKMVNALLAGAIPISDSTAERAQLFNRDSYIAVNVAEQNSRSSRQ